MVDEIEIATNFIVVINPVQLDMFEFLFLLEETTKNQIQILDSAPPVLRTFEKQNHLGGGPTFL